MNTVNEQTAESERLLMNVIGACGMLLLRVRKVDFAHAAAADLEAYLLAAGLAARDIDADLFDDARGCISGTLH
jgi:hypothetical protein